ncbi:unnamed protein product [Pleuronectes platessa]|uniref:Uncharacterized protein n=1 Tax=Pleuronectes platessa TaxID=8262 RepID=A0A9N7V674_PLEPL|nr:unnamed protein product [Pleuronectes platessa]
MFPLIPPLPPRPDRAVLLPSTEVSLKPVSSGVITSFRYSKGAEHTPGQEEGPEHRAATDHFILWDKTSLSVSTHTLGEHGWSSKAETSNAGSGPQYAAITLKYAPFSVGGTALFRLLGVTAF